MLFFFYEHHKRQFRIQIHLFVSRVKKDLPRRMRWDKRRTFHFSNSSCFTLYCFSNSFNTFFSPSEFVLSAGITSFTVLSMRTPLIRRKHFRSCGKGSKVSRTSLRSARSAVVEALDVLEGYVVSVEGDCATQWLRDIGRRSLDGVGSSTCALQLPVPRRQSSVRFAASWTCSWSTALVTLNCKTISKMLVQ